MRLYYACRDLNNFGDIVPAYVYEKLGIKTYWTTAEDAEVFAGGSIMQDVSQYSTVLCCGFGSAEQICKAPRKIYSVRGKLTRDRLLELGIDCPELYKDFVDFLPYIFNPKIEKRYKIGLLPHYIDYEYCLGLDNEVVIDICSGVESVIIQVLQCETIQTSSLHGIILAQTYGIPWTWVRHNKLASPDFKFQDYFSRIGLKNMTPELI